MAGATEPDRHRAGSPGQRVPRWPGAGLQRASVAGLGVLLVALASVGFLVADGPIWVRIVESGLPVGLSLVFLAFGVFLWEREEPPASMLVISAWGVAGSVVTGALAVWLVAVVTFQDVAIESPLFVVTSSATVGATFGGAAGYYHARLLETTAEIRRQNVRLDEFAGIVSHDLRNPLGVASGGLQLARETGAAEDFERVERAHDRMERLIDELLTLAQRGQDRADLEPVSLATAVERAHRAVDPTLDVTTCEDVQVRADPDRLVALLENLLRNAVEHGSTSPASHARQDAVEHGSTRPASQARQDVVEHAGTGPTVTVGALADGGGFYVSDDGPGIPSDDRVDVFAHGVTTSADGTGLGLSIVRRICDAHGWSVDVTESETGGARFEVRT